MYKLFINLNKWIRFTSCEPKKVEERTLNGNYQPTVNYKGKTLS